jgi:hypothetical protein
MQLFAITLASISLLTPMGGPGRAAKTQHRSHQDAAT